MISKIFTLQGKIRTRIENDKQNFSPLTQKLIGESFSRIHISSHINSNVV